MVLYVCVFGRHYVVCWAHFRVPQGEDLFYGEMASLPRGDPSRETPESYCLCESGLSSVCGRKAVSDSTEEHLEPQEHLRIGVPISLIAKPRQRRKRQTNGVPQYNDTRLYPTSYRYFSEIV